MMDKLSVGMYVRNENGIAKYLGLGKDCLYADENNMNKPYFDKHVFDKCIFNGLYGDSLDSLDTFELENCKISFNLIDLIEVGDYVNGYRVKEIGMLVQPIVICENILKEESWFANKHIKSIVTHEQFESIAYHVERE